MLYLLGITGGLLMIIIFVSKGLKEGKKSQKSVPSDASGNNMMKDLSEDDLHLLTRIISVGLVDADPDYLQHLKGFRDLTAG